MIEWLLIGTAWIWGVKAIHTHPFIFWKQANFVEHHIGKWICKPLFRCPVCMSSVWGTYLFFFSDQSGLMNWIIYVIALAGIQFLIVEFLYPENVEPIQEEKKES